MGEAGRGEILENNHYGRTVVPFASGHHLDLFRLRNAIGGKGSATDFKAPAGRCGWRWGNYSLRGAGARSHLVPRRPRCPHNRFYASWEWYERRAYAELASWMLKFLS